MKKIAFLWIATLLLILMGSCSKTEIDTYSGLYGIVSDAATADAISGVSVVLSPGGVSQVTGDDGRFQFNNLDPAQYTITVDKTGYKPNRKIVTAVTGQLTEANIPMTQSN